MDGLEQFLSQYPDIKIVRVIEVLLLDQAFEWQDGPGPSVEQYLQRFPNSALQRKSVTELVYGEMRAAGALGLAIDVDDYLARFPDLAEPLRRQMEVSKWLEDEGMANDSLDRPH